LGLAPRPNECVAREMLDSEVITAADIESWLHCRRIPYLRARHSELAAAATPYGAHLSERRRAHRAQAGAKMGVGAWIARGDVDRAAADTREAMAQRLGIIGNPVIVADHPAGPLVSTPDFLVRDAEVYAPRDVTLAKSVRNPEHVYRLRFHAEAIGRATGRTPAYGSMVLQDGTIANVSLPATKDVERIITEIRTSRSGEAWPEVVYAHHKCGPCRFSVSCLTRFRADHDISLVYDLNTSAWRALRERGYLRYDDLAAADLASMGKITGIAARRLPRAIAQAQSLVTGESRLLAPPVLPDSVIFLDLEGDPDEDVDYLWGILDGDRYLALVSEGPDGDRRVFQAFLDHCQTIFQRNPATRIVHFGSYEPLEFRRYVKRHGAEKHLVEAIDRAFFDLHREVRRTLVAPVTSYGLKALAHQLGFSWRLQGSSASWSIVRYRAWRQSNDPAIRAEIEQYNEDDVRATQLVFNTLRDGIPKK
jgi:predicted RecB family nuclease